MRPDRNKVMDFGTNQIDKLIVHYCLKCKYTYHADLKGNPKDVRQIKEFRNVLESWRDDGSEVNASRIWNCMFGQFDAKPGWEFEIERAFMELNKWEYIEVDSHMQKTFRKGCVARLIRQCKVNMVKRLNNASKKTHHGLIGIKRKSANSPNDPAFKPRKRGYFVYDDYVKESVRTPCRDALSCCFVTNNVCIAPRTFTETKARHCDPEAVRCCMLLYFTVSCCSISELTFSNPFCNSLTDVR